MSISWQEVESKPEFQSLSADEKNKAQDQYFESVVAPRVGDNRDIAYSQFKEQFNYDDGGIIDTVSDMFTGNDRQTRATEELGELETSGGFLSGIGDAATNAKLASVLSVTSDPNERAKILKSAYPNEIGIQYDEKGNVIAGIQGTDKRVLLNAPGLSATDLFTGGQQALLSIPAAMTGGGLGAGAKVAQAAAQQGLVTGAVEGAQASQGGDFDTANVITDMLLAGGGEAVPQYLKYLKNKSGGAADEATEAAIQARTGEITNPLSREAQTETLTNTIAQQGAKRSPNLQQAAGDVNPDLNVIEAAERLGVAEDLTPGMFSRNEAYKDFEGAIRAKGASDISSQANQAIMNVAQKADDLITEFGGTTDKAGLSEEFKTRVSNTIGDLDTQVTKAYDDVNALVSPTQKVDMSDVFVELKEQADNLGGDKYLEPFEKRILAISESNPSYSLIDKERKKIGAALHKKQGAYKDMDTGRLKRMYGLLTDAQGKDLSDEAKNAWDVAKGLTRQRKALEDDSIKMFGKDLSGAFTPKFGSAVKKLQGSDYRDFDNMIKAIPDREMRERAMISALNDVFTQGSRKEKQMNIPGFVDWYESVQRQPALMKRINDNLPAGASKRLKDIFTVTKAMRDANSRVVKTGVATETLNNLDKAEGMMSKIYNVGKQGLAAEVVSSSIGLYGAGFASVLASNMTAGAKASAVESADKLVSSPEFKRLAVQLARDNFRATRAAEIAERAVKRSDKYKRWYNNLPSQERQAIIRGGLIGYLGQDQSEY